MHRMIRALPGSSLWLALILIAGALAPGASLAQSDSDIEGAASTTEVEPLEVQPRLPEGATDSEAAVETDQVPQRETFQFPAYNGYRLNFCLRPAEGQCGQVTADKWCREKGFAKVASWSRDPNVGALFPTIFMELDAICDKFLCDGFGEITCTR